MGFRQSSTAGRIATPDSINASISCGLWPSSERISRVCCQRVAGGPPGLAGVSEKSGTPRARIASTVLEAAYAGISVV